MHSIQFLHQANLAKMYNCGTMTVLKIAIVGVKWQMAVTLIKEIVPRIKSMHFPFGSFEMQSRAANDLFNFHFRNHWAPFDFDYTDLWLCIVKESIQQICCLFLCSYYFTFHCFYSAPAAAAAAALGRSIRGKVIVHFSQHLRSFSRVRFYLRVIIIHKCHEITIISSSILRR